MFWRFTKMPQAPQLHTPNPALILSPPTLGPSSKHNTSRRESLPTVKIISNILLMNQNYIKSLKVDENACWNICFRGSIGGEPTHVALVWYIPGRKTPQDIKSIFWTTTRIRLICAVSAHVGSAPPGAWHSPRAFIPTGLSPFKANLSLFSLLVPFVNALIANRWFRPEQI